MAPESGEPEDELAAETFKWMETLKLKYTRLSEIHEAGPDPTVMKALQNGIDRANKYSISNATKIQKFALLPHDFSIPTGKTRIFEKVLVSLILMKCFFFEFQVNSGRR